MRRNLSRISGNLFQFFLDSAALGERNSEMSEITRNEYHFLSLGFKKLKMDFPSYIVVS